mmetsp:Transcript_30171/g.46017  ORF Transcript_30171/g.46017 Transcript_30171/m.46017 type:complete len:85 (+) Transcript_30171:95-349(+)
MKLSQDQSEIDSILQRLKRSNEISAQPVNQAKALMGRRLGACFLNDMQEAKGQEIIQVMISPQINPSLAEAFFHDIEDRIYFNS